MKHRAFSENGSFLHFTCILIINRKLLPEIIKDDIKVVNNIICHSVNSLATLSANKIAYLLLVPKYKLKSWNDC